MHLKGLVKATPKMKELVGDLKGEEREALLNDNADAAFYTGRVLSGQFYIGTELHKMYARLDAILGGEMATIKASAAIFTGALAE